MKLHLLYKVPLLSLSLFVSVTHGQIYTQGQTPFNWTVGQRGEWCSPPDFKWKEKGAKLMEDCDIQKDQMKVWVNDTTDRTECITSVFLMIDGEPMTKWEKWAQPNHDG